MEPEPPRGQGAHVVFNIVCDYGRAADLVLTGTSSNSLTARAQGGAHRVHELACTSSVREQTARYLRVCLRVCVVARASGVHQNGQTHTRTPASWVVQVHLGTRQRGHAFSLAECWRLVMPLRSVCDHGPKRQ